MQRPQSGVLQVKDANGGDWITAEGNVNILARDVSCSKTPAKQTTMNGITIDGSSFAVIHQIPTALYHADIPDFGNSGEAKKYMTRFAIH